MNLSRFIAASACFAVLNGVIAALPATQKQTASILTDENFELTDKVKQEGKPSSWWLARAYLTGARPDVAVLGSSQIGGLQAADANLTGRSIDFVDNHHCPTIEKALSNSRHEPERYVFLSALPGAMISDHFAIAKALYKTKGAPPLVVLTISPRDFIDNSLPCAGATEPYRYFSKFSDMSAYVNRAFNRPWSRLEYFAGQEIPTRRLEIPLKESSKAFVQSFLLGGIASGANASGPNEGSKSISASQSAAGNLVADQVKFVMGGYEGNIKPGQAVLTPNLPKLFVDNSRDYRRRYKNTHPDTYDVQFDYLSDFLSFLRSEGSTVLVLGMPLTPENRAILGDKFFAEYGKKVAEVCSRNKAVYVSLVEDPRFGRGDFCDTVHLNADGGSKLASAVASIITANEPLTAALDAHTGSLATRNKPTP
ncbi:MAG: hypothetical protein K2Y32_14615 [Candidatus Obscuribacterales bacterium]|nr:hypothetical protein [Candidatus Obscuribacterales bacterium]